MIAAMQAKNVEIVRVMIEGTFRAIRIPVTTGDDGVQAMFYAVL